jgi:uncharacterized protein YjeT (DUF2065 family)
MGSTLTAAFALLLVLEGLLPFAAPRLWRRSFERLLALRDGQLRFCGLAAIAFGLALYGCTLAS